jgi:hypothetical protein
VDYNEHDVTEDEEASSGCVCDSPFLCAGGALNYVKRKNGRGGEKEKKKREERGKRVEKDREKKEDLNLMTMVLIIFLWHWALTAG